METFNPDTGDFENQEPSSVEKGKKMKTLEGHTVLLLDDNTVFDPSTGRITPRTAFGDLEEVDETSKSE